jgi:hypothetical protein
VSSAVDEIVLAFSRDGDVVMVDWEVSAVRKGLLFVALFILSKFPFL